MGSDRAAERPHGEVLLSGAGAESVLASLLEAYEAASQAGDCRWQFAVEASVLLAQGASINLLRSLVRARLAEHRQEKSKPQDETRKFLPLMNLSLPDRSCLVLTDAGIAYTREALQGLRAQHTSTIAGLLSKGMPQSRQTPDWDASRRELRIAGQLVKSYRVTAVNQERVLVAFQSAGWPECLDDPLPQTPDQDRKRRLHRTIQKLNHLARRELLCFRGDGTGRRICWGAGRLAVAWSTHGDGGV